MADKNASAQGQSGNSKSEPVRQGANTYRVYIANVADPANPSITLAFIQADKYGPAWKAARKLLRDGKPHDDAPRTTSFFKDEAGTSPYDPGFGGHVTVANVLDVKVRASKMDPARIKAILEDENSSPEDRIAAVQAMLAVNTPAQATA